MKNNQKPVKLTPALLKHIIEEEVKKGFGKMEDPEKRADDAEEVDADEFADALDKHIDYMKALKVEERRLVKRLARVQEARRRAAKTLATRV